MSLEDDFSYIDSIAAEVEPLLEASSSLQAVISVFRYQIEVAKQILEQAHVTSDPDRQSQLMDLVTSQRSRMARFLLTAQIDPLRKRIKPADRDRLESMEST